MDARLATPWASAPGDGSPDVPLVYVLMLLWLLLALIVVGASEIEE